MIVKVHKVKENFWVFECPGCNSLHSIKTPPWTFNKDLVKPTVSPSILVPGSISHPRCHSFIRDGLIQFLEDCDHELKGQTVEIPGGMIQFIEGHKLANQIVGLPEEPLTLEEV